MTEDLLSAARTLLREANDAHPVCCTCCLVCSNCGNACLPARLADTIRQLIKHTR